MAMPKRNETGSKIVARPRAASRIAGGPPKGPQRSPARAQPLRTSPGLLAGHYAGCKFSEPPLPSALPLPPQHWMQTTRSLIMPFCGPGLLQQHHRHHHQDISQHLKMLLKVQA